MPSGRTGIDGLRETDAVLARVPDDVGDEARAIDATVGERMVAAMRGAVPVDTGRLLNGIVARQDGATVTVVASAVRGTFDYARIVEFGRQAARHADAAFFARPEGGGMGAEPYFWPSAHEILLDREGAMDAAVDHAARREGLR